MKNCEQVLEKFLTNVECRLNKMCMDVQVSCCREVGWRVHIYWHKKSVFPNRSTASFFFPWFRENVNVTCKIVSFLPSLDYFLLKNVIVFLFGNQISKWCRFGKRPIFDLLFTFFSHQGKDTQIPPAYILYIYIFCSPYWLFLSPQFSKEIANLSCMVSLWCDSWCWFFFRPFWSNQ